MFQIDYKSGIPIYDQIVNSVIRLKVLGALKEGEALPSVRAMALKLSINPNTVQRAYAILEEKGIIYSVSGKGSFIAMNNSCEQTIKNSALEKVVEEVKNAALCGVKKDEIIAALNSVFKEEK